ncbi:unnamed protein product [Cyberlindnera jadinii]|uniref:E3 ubiquitin-protein ligase PEP5 n=1 Tax=Cyberlindnera jadinii (strain ATCC 18201 / CBS 1600 / BCRC 20928 / JCM 3617 / NBRC 0987 / NRRL Y-1542) TaxID=983966 RepID=A0A0H5BYV8_CYBJN|nr:unnamed protein product [Cyberlindnera jadinii]
MSWRQFQFFETTPIRDPNLGTDRPLYSDPSLTAVCGLDQYLVIATHNSTIQLIDKNLQFVKQFVSYEKGWNVTFLHALPSVNMFATLAERQGQPAQLKLWDLEKVMDKDLDPQGYHTVVHIKNGSNAYPVTCLSSSEGFNIVCVGYANGVVIVIRGDLLRDRGSSQTAAFKNQDPITNVQLVQGNNNDPILYVTSTSKIVAVPTTQSYKPGSELVLDSSRGADLGNAILDGDKLVVAKTDGLVYYSATGEPHYTVPLEMQKKRIFKFGKNMLIVTTNTQESSGLVLNGYTEPTKIVMADMEHKLLAMAHTIASTIQNILLLWDDVYCLTSDGVLYRVHERDVNSQIDIVTKRGLYPIAIQIAEGKVDHTKLLEIKRSYGDYLYEKNETTRAMDQYIETIQLGKTSEIIRMYKDSKEVGNLSRFLENMLQAGMAVKEHVTLLLCTYCKLKQVDKLNEFIERYDKETNDLMRVDFDLDVVVGLCRDTGFLEQASKLSQNLGYPLLAVDILLRDNKDAYSALQYIKTLPVDETLRVCIQYARLLLEAAPNVTTAMLIEVFTGKYKPEREENKVIKDETPVLLQSYTAFVNYMSKLNSRDEPDEDVIQDTYQPPRPRVIFPSFVNRPNEFVIFLEACAQSYDKFEGNPKDKNDVLTTLYELYLTIASTSENTEEWHEKALNLVKRNDLNSNTILLISNVFEFDQGEIIAREGPGFQVDLFRSYVASGQVENCIKLLDLHGKEEPELCSLALMFYTSSDEVFQRVGEKRFRDLLRWIKDDEIMTPLEFIQALSVNKITTVDIIKDFIVEFMETERREIEINEKFIKSYQADIDTQREKIHKTSETLTVQPTVCSSCSQKLRDDTVYFRCSHAFHKSCLPEEVCPLCAPMRETLRNIKENQRAIGERNELFQESLEESEDRFRVVTDFFGKGAMTRI